MRADWKWKIILYTGKNVRQKALEIKSQIESYFSKIQEASMFIYSVSVNSSIIGVSTDHITSIVTYLTNFRKFVNPKPRSGLILTKNSTYHVSFILSWLNDNDYSLFSIHNKDINLFEIRRHRKDEIVDGFDFRNTGEVHGYLENIDKIIDAIPEGTSWSYVKMIGFNESMNINYNKYSDFLKCTSNAAFHIDLDTMSDFVKNITKDCNYEYLIFNNKNEILFGSQITPFNKGTGIYSKYMHLDETNLTIWQKLVEEADLDTMKEQRILVGDRKYAFVSIPITTGREVTHRLLMMGDASAVVFEWYSVTSVFFVVYFGIVLFTVFLALVIGKLIANNQEKELDSLAASPETVVTINRGVLYDIIQRIHKLELNYPDEIILNRTLDECVDKIASQHLHPFVNVTRCPFCNEFIQEEPDILPDESEGCFVSWQQQFAKRYATYKNLGDKFPWDKNKENPEESLISLFMTIVHSEGLYFSEVDPDCLFKMVIDFSKNYCSDPLLTSLQINNLYHIMHTQFKYWVQSKADLFALYLTALFINIKMKDMEAYIVKVYEDKGYKNANESLERQQKTIGNDRQEELYNLFIIKFITSYIPSLGIDTKFTTHFMWLFKSLLSSRYFSNYLPIFGEFSLILESPHFAPMEKMFDRRDFLLFILVFCSISPYWSPLSFVDEATDRLVQNNLDKSEDEQKNLKFNIGIERIIVDSFINVISKFIQIDGISKNYEAVIERWENLYNELEKK